MKRFLAKQVHWSPKQLIFSGFLAITLAIVPAAFFKCSSIVSDGGTETGDAKVVTFEYEVDTCGKMLAKFPLPLDTADYWADYCTAEKLVWAYDSASDILQLLHARCLFRCAAKLAVQIIDTNGCYGIIEKDTSTVYATCLPRYYDIYFKIENVSSSAAVILVKGKSFNLELHAGNGIEIIDTLDAWGCRVPSSHQTPPLSAPYKPRGIKAVAIVPTSIRISWSRDTGAQSYEVYRNSAGSTRYDTLGPLTDSFYIDTARMQNVSYWYRIKASNQWGDSPLSDSVVIKIIPASNTDIHDNILIAYKLSPQQEAQFSATDGRISAFWSRWEELNAGSLQVDYLQAQASDSSFALNRCAASPFLDASDAQFAVKAAYTVIGVYLLVDAIDDQWADSGDVVDIFFDQMPLGYLLDTLNWFNPTQWAVTFSSRHLQVPMGFSKAVSGYIYSYYDDLEMRLLDHTALFGSSSYHGITMEIINVGTHQKQQEWFIPWSEWKPGEIDEALQGQRYGFSPGYYDNDAETQGCMNIIRWPKKYDPFHEPPDANTWGELELGPLLP